MKKVLIIIALFISIFTITGCKQSNLKEISFDEFYEMIEQEETFIIEIFQDGCSHCQVFTPRFESVLEEYGVTAYSLNFSNINEAQYNKFKKDFNDDKDIGTPTVLFIVKGKEKTSMNRLSGEPSENEIIRKLKQNDYID